MIIYGNLRNAIGISVKYSLSNIMFSTYFPFIVVVSTMQSVYLVGPM